MAKTNLSELDVDDHNGSDAGLYLGGVLVTATAAELNAAANIATPGVVEASKGVVVDANKDIGDFRNLDVVNLDAGASGTAGTVDVFPATAANGKLAITCANQGAGNATATLTMDQHTQATTTHIQDPGAVANAYLVQTTAALTLAKADVLQNLTATATEINGLDASPMGAHVFTVGAQGGDVINVGIQLKDLSPADLAIRGSIYAYLSDDANGDSLTATAPSGGCAIGTDGVLIPVTPALSNALLVDGNLAIDATAEKFKTTQTACYTVNGISRTKAATIELTFTAAHVITALKFGVIRVQINAAGTISTKVPGSPQAYDDAPTALAALPAVDAGNVSLGYIAIENNAGDWTANTDDLTNASDVTTAAFNDSAEVSVGGPKAFQLVSESDGDIDIDITEAGAGTWYLVAVLPNGKLLPSGAITFV